MSQSKEVEFYSNLFIYLEKLFWLVYKERILGTHERRGEQMIKEVIVEVQAGDGDGLE